MKNWTHQMRRRLFVHHAPDFKKDLMLGLDELSQIPAVNRLAAALTAGRKPGLFVVAAVQHVNQVAIKYGEHWKEAFANFSTKLILGQGDAESSNFWSKEIGETEIREWHRSKSWSQGSLLDNLHSSGSRTEHVRLRPRVLAHEIRELPRLRGYLMLGHYPAVKVRLKPRNRPTVCDPHLLDRRRKSESLSAGEALREKLENEKSAGNGSHVGYEERPLTRAASQAGQSGMKTSSGTTAITPPEGLESLPNESTCSTQIDLSDLDLSKR